MAPIYGWTGKILDVNLSTGEINIIPTQCYVPKFVGGLGIAARLAWQMLHPGIDALSEENILFIMVGPLTGTLASGAGRLVVAGIAPQQRPSTFSRSSMGGHWGAELKYAGYDGIVIRGRAQQPVYLWIHNDQVELLGAEKLWGRGTFGTTRQLRAIHGPHTRVISCGQAGENLCRIACIQSETGNAAGQGGFGAVMGSKRLKAIAVRGTRGVRVADPRRLLDLCLNASREPLGPQPNSSPGRRGHALDPVDYPTRLHKCGFCLSPCVGRLFMDVPGEALPGTHNVTRHCYGYRATTLEGHIEARAMTSDYGLNGWEIAYGIIPWLQMCRQQGLIDHIDGLEIPIPDRPILYLRDIAPVPAKFLTMLLRKIAFREGELGDALADGACYAAERLFGQAGVQLLDRIYPRRAGQTSHWNAHWGTGGSPYFPFWLVPVLQWCVDTRDPASDATHQYTEHVLRYIDNGPNKGVLTPEIARRVCKEVYGHPEVWNPQYTYDEPDTKVLPAIFHHDRAMIVESLILCDREHTRVFSMETPDHKADTALMAKLFSAVTGCETSEAELDRAGERIFNLLRAIDVRDHGRNRTIDEATAQSLAFPAFTEGEVLDMDKFKHMLTRYYQVRGWDPKTGWPTEEKLCALNLADVAETLTGGKRCPS